MKKYTIIYSEYFNRGSHRLSTVKKENVETDNLKELISKTPKFDCNTHFIFDGWAVDSKD
jgi:hypothetical protein